MATDGSDFWGILAGAAIPTGIATAASAIYGYVTKRIDHRIARREALEDQRGDRDLKREEAERAELDALRTRVAAQVSATLDRTIAERDAALRERDEAREQASDAEARADAWEALYRTGRHRIVSYVQAVGYWLDHPGAPRPIYTPAPMPTQESVVQLAAQADDGG